MNELYKLEKIALDGYTAYNFPKGAFRIADVFCGPYWFTLP